MKAVLEFSLPEENSDFELANNGLKYSIVIEEMLNYFRSIYKHGDDSVAAEYAEKHRDHLVELLMEYSLPTN